MIVDSTYISRYCSWDSSPQILKVGIMFAAEIDSDRFLVTLVLNGMEYMSNVEEVYEKRGGKARLACLKIKFSASPFINYFGSLSYFASIDGGIALSPSPNSEKGENSRNHNQH